MGQRLQGTAAPGRRSSSRAWQLRRRACCRLVSLTCRPARPAASRHPLRLRGVADEAASSFWALGRSLSRASSTGVVPMLVLTWMVSEMATSASRWALRGQQVVVDLGPALAAQLLGNRHAEEAMLPAEIEVGGVGPMLPLDVALVRQTVAGRAELARDQRPQLAVLRRQLRIGLDQLGNVARLTRIDRSAQEVARVVRRRRGQVVGDSVAGRAAGPGHRRRSVGCRVAEAGFELLQGAGRAFQPDPQQAISVSAGRPAPAGHGCASSRALLASSRASCRARPSPTSACGLSTSAAAVLPFVDQATERVPRATRTSSSSACRALRWARCSKFSASPARPPSRGHRRASSAAARSP